MKHHKRAAGLLCLWLIPSLVLAGCAGQEPPALTAEQIAERDDMAQIFMAELRDIYLPMRSQPLLMADRGVLMCDGGEMDNPEVLEVFLAGYDAGTDCVLTVCFQSENSLVFTRIIRSGEAGYAFRYQYNASESIAVLPKQFDELRVERLPEPLLTKLTLLYAGEEIGTTFTFREKPADGMPPAPGV